MNTFSHLSIAGIAALFATTSSAHDCRAEDRTGESIEHVGNVVGTMHSAEVDLMGIFKEAFKKKGYDTSILKPASKAASVIGNAADAASLSAKTIAAYKKNGTGAAATEVGQYSLEKVTEMALSKASEAGATAFGLSEGPVGSAAEFGYHLGTYWRDNTEIGKTVYNKVQDAEYAAIHHPVQCVDGMNGVCVDDEPAKKIPSSYAKPALSEVLKEAGLTQDVSQSGKFILSTATVTGEFNRWDREQAMLEQMRLDQIKRQIEAEELARREEREEKAEEARADREWRQYERDRHEAFLQRQADRAAQYSGYSGSSINQVGPYTYYPTVQNRVGVYNGLSPMTPSYVPSPYVGPSPYIAPSSYDYNGGAGWGPRGGGGYSGVATTDCSIFTGAAHDSCETTNRIVREQKTELAPPPTSSVIKQNFQNIVGSSAASSPSQYTGFWPVPKPLDFNSIGLGGHNYYPDTDRRDCSHGCSSK